MTETDTQQQEQPEATPPGKAKLRGSKLMKVWLRVYLVVIIAYVFHCVTGDEFLTLNELDTGRRLWDALHLEIDGAAQEFEPGTALSPVTMEALRAGSAAAGSYMRDGDEWTKADKGPVSPTMALRVFKGGRFHKLPWSTIFGLFNFLGLALLLYTHLGDPIPALLIAHAEKVKEQLLKARTAMGEAEVLETKRKDLLESLDAEHEQAKVRAVKDADAEKEYIVTAAKHDAERMAETIKSHLDADAHAAGAELRANIAARILKKAHDRFATGINKDEHDRMMQSFAVQLEGMGPND